MDSYIKLFLYNKIKGVFYMPKFKTIIKGKARNREMQSVILLKKDKDILKKNISEPFIVKENEKKALLKAIEFNIETTEDKSYYNKKTFNIITKKEKLFYNIESLSYSFQLKDILKQTHGETQIYLNLIFYDVFLSILEIYLNVLALHWEDEDVKEKNILKNIFERLLYFYRKKEHLQYHSILGKIIRQKIKDDGLYFIKEDILLLQNRMKDYDFSLIFNKI